jgi:hypothetical protein
MLRWRRLPRRAQPRARRSAGARSHDSSWFIGIKGAEDAGPVGPRASVRQRLLRRRAPGHARRGTRPRRGLRGRRLARSSRPTARGRT